MSELGTAKKFELVAGNLALDFCNTVGGKRGVVEREYLSSPLQLIAWSWQSGVFDEKRAREAERWAAAHRSEAEAAVSRARKLREAIFRTFNQQVNDRRPEQADVEVLNEELAKALGRLRLAAEKGEGGFHWEWSEAPKPLEEPLGRVAQSAAELLVNGRELAQVRMCHGDTCGWLFIDASRNHSRCWCDMRDCGNRAKVRRHRQKARTRNAEV